MGYEFKPKKGKERNMKLYAFLTGIAISCVISVANAQTISPDSMLGNETPQPVPEQQAPAQPEPQAPQAPQQPEFFNLPANFKCATMGTMRGLLEQVGGQYPWAMGFNGKAALQNSPFDGMVITKHPMTNDYSIVLISTENNVACLVAVGTEIRLEIPENTE